MTAKIVRILLTGASGQVGGALRAALDGHEVIAPRRAAFDLERVDAIVPFVESVRPDLVINCAAYTAVDEAERDSDRAEAINGVAPGHIAAAANAVGAGVIHISTDYVFAGSAERPYRETDACAPLNAYGRTKLQGERAVAAAGSACLIVRTAWIYDAQGRNFLRTMLRLGAERTSIDVVSDQIGAPTSAVVVAQYLAAILTQMDGKPSEYLRRHGGILHATCAGKTTWYGFAMAIFEEARRRGLRLSVETVRPITTAQYPTPVRRPRYSVLDLTRLKNEFGLAPTPWRDAMAQIMSQVVALN